MKGFAKFVFLFLGIVLVCFGFVPLGIGAFVAGRIVYGSWGAALTFYAAQLGMAAVAIVGVIPIYGNEMHYEIVTDYIIPFATSNGAGPSWLLSLWGFLSGVVAAMCPGALVFQILEARGRSHSVPKLVLILAAAVFLGGSALSAILFFGP